MTEDPLDRLVRELAAILQCRGLQLAVAESCTGGMLCAALTAVPGASGWFRGGVVAYDNAIKIAVLDVPETLLRKAGAVSPETAVAMACGIRQRFGVDVGVGITGIAGPGGATPGKPVGRVCVGIAAPDSETVAVLSLKGDRAAIRLDACRRALESLIRIAQTGQRSGAS